MIVKIKRETKLIIKNYIKIYIFFFFPGFHFSYFSLLQVLDFDRPGRDIHIRKILTYNPTLQGKFVQGELTDILFL